MTSPRPLHQAQRDCHIIGLVLPCTYNHEAAMPLAPALLEYFSLSLQREYFIFPLLSGRLLVRKRMSERSLGTQTTHFRLDDVSESTLYVLCKEYHFGHQIEG